MCGRGTSISTVVVVGIARGLLLKQKKDMQDVDLSREWARSVLRRMGFTRQVLRQNLPKDFMGIKKQLICV